MDKDFIDFNILNEFFNNATDAAKDINANYNKTKEKQYETEKDIFKDNAKEYVEYKKKEQEEKTKRHKETCETIIKAITLVGGIGFAIMIGYNNPTMFNMFITKNNIV